MSQMMESPEVIGDESPAADDAAFSAQDVRPYEFRQREEFTYRPMPVMAPVSLVLGLCSILALLGVIGLPLALIGVVLSALCLRKIQLSEGEYSGKALAAIGLALSLLFLVSGAAFHSFAYATEVPEGFRRINFSSDVSKKGLQVVDGRPDVHADVKALDGTKVFVKGYMYPTQQTHDLPSFVLVKDSGDCCFGGNPAITDMIMVQMEPGKTVDFKTGLVSVAGTFHAKSPTQAGPLSTVYRIDGTHFSRSRTSF